MCGIAGVFATGESQRPSATVEHALSMVRTLVKRGPDGEGSWGDPAAGIAFGHRRLSIVDLTDTGAQPMQSADGRYIITFNGEVYNFRELRDELAAYGHSFHGTSDTEVMLAAITQWGLKGAVQRFIGMFSFGLFDRTSKTLSLVRDRMGVKPLYWSLQGGVLMFGSGLRALMAHPACAREIDRDAVAAFIRYSYVPTPASIFKNVFKLPPASILTIAPGQALRISRYWTIPASSSAAPLTDEATATEQLDGLLRDSINKRMISDVPLGAFLSGGIDSSTVVALMQAQSTHRIKTFTVGFSDPAFNEADHARAVAEHLGTDHTEVTLDAEDALKLVTDIPEWFDEPFADASQLPTYLVAAATRKHVTVALSGDGGDELFGGYPKYRSFEKLWRHAGTTPRPLRAAAGSLLTVLPDKVLRMLTRGADDRIGEKVRRAAGALAVESRSQAQLAVDAVGLRETIVLDAADAPSPQMQPIESLDAISQMQLNDMLGYLPDDILTKVDRCTMAVSLEAREPLLDHRLVEFVWTLSPGLRHGGSVSKRLLRNVLKRYVPQGLTDRPKRGFSVPLAAWLRGPLRPWADELLSEASLAKDGLFDVPTVRNIWRRHLSGAETNATGLWNVLMMQAWLRRWMPS